MKNSALRFARPTEDETDALLDLCRTHILGPEICTAVWTDGAESERLWAARDGDGSLHGAVYDAFAYKLFLTWRTAAVGRHDPGAAGIFAPPRRFARFAVLEKKRRILPSPSGAEKLTDGRLLDFYRLLSGDLRMPASLERSYVYAARCANRGLAEAYGICGEAGILSGAQILAKNDVYALIGNVYTKETYRGRGFASAALAACEAAADAEGLIPVLYCESGMLPFYRERGYERIRPHGL